MKASEIISANRAALAETLTEKYRSVISCDGRIQYKIYIWEDGEIECQEGVQGDNSYLVPNRGESRKLYYVTKVSVPCANIWDLAGESAPDDESEKAAKEADIIDWLMDEYRSNVDDVIDSAIEDAERDESYYAE
ncbi:MAG: hypothetical protein J6T99_00235 [Oscillospiraceae bacterium]|nr:hypothetical protein [Oscillospiraceae bacterium]